MRTALCDDLGIRYPIFGFTPSPEVAASLAPEVAPPPEVAASSAEEASLPDERVRTIVKFWCAEIATKAAATTGISAVSHGVTEVPTNGKEDTESLCATNAPTKLLLGGW